MKNQGWLLLAGMVLCGCPNYPMQEEVPDPGVSPTAPAPAAPPVRGERIAFPRPARDTGAPADSPAPVPPPSPTAEPTIPLRPDVCGQYQTCGFETDREGNEVSCGTCDPHSECRGGRCHELPAISGCDGIVPAALDPLTGGVRGRQRCDPTGFCTVNHPSEVSPFEVTGTGPSDVWVSGRNFETEGAVLHWDGQTWSEVSIAGSGRPWRIWAAAPNDVWASNGTSAVARWDGERWTSVVVPGGLEISGVSGSSPEDVWLVGPNGAVHWDGAAFGAAHAFRNEPLRAEDLSSPKAVFTLSPDFAIAAGAGGCEKWDGASWTSFACARGYAHLWASSPDDFWSVSVQGASMSVSYNRTHWLGGARTSESWNDYSGWGVPFASIWGYAKDDVWTNGGYRFDGSSWRKQCDRIELRSFWGTRADDQFGVQGNQIAHFDGERWTEVARLARKPGTFGGNHQGALWILWPTGELSTFEGKAWAHHPAPDQRAEYTATFGTAVDDVWTVTSSGRIDHWDGSAWSLRFSGDGAGRGARGIAFDREHAFVLRPRVDSPVPAPLLELRNGEWAPVAFDFGPRARLSDVWGTGPSDVWVAGSESDDVTPLRSKVWHFDGATWTLVHEELGRSAVALLGAQGSLWLIDSGNGKSRLLSWSGSAFVPVRDLERSSFGGMADGTAHDLWVALWPLTSPESKTPLAHFDGTSWETLELRGRASDLWQDDVLGTFTMTEHGLVSRRPPTP